MSGAQAVRVTARDGFDLAQWRVEVMQAEGAVHLRLFSDGWSLAADKAGRGLTLANAFAGPETAAQLRAIADHLEGLEWTE
jgi:hypothetical protein